MMRAAILAALLLAAACDRSAREHPTSTGAGTEEKAMSEPEFEGLRFQMTFDDTRRLATDRGWQLFLPEDPSDQVQKANLVPPAGQDVKRANLRFEGGKLVSMVIDYAQPDAARAELRTSYSTSHHSAQGWAMTDAAHSLLVVVTDDGRQLVAMDVARSADQREMTAMWGSLFEDKVPR